MGNKTSNVIVRIEPDVKEKAEAILKNLGLSPSGVINALYHQIIFTKGVPFSMSVPERIPCLADMSEQELIDMLNKGIEDAKNGRTEDVDKAFDDLNSLINAHEKL